MLGGLDDVRWSTSSNKKTQMNGTPNISADNVKSFGNFLKRLIFDTCPGLLEKNNEVG